MALNKIDALMEKLSSFSTIKHNNINIINDNAFVMVKKANKRKSKTRLSKCIGNDLAVRFASISLKDLLMYFSKLPHKKFILFAPKEAQSNFEQLLTEIELINNEYTLIPITNSDLKTSDLGNILSEGIVNIRNEPHNINGDICIVAMIVWN